MYVFGQQFFKCVQYFVDTIWQPQHCYAAIYCAAMKLFGIVLSLDCDEVKRSKAQFGSDSGGGECLPNILFA